jgi:hypothetical protein
MKRDENAENASATDPIRVGPIRGAFAAGRAVRDAWLILGITLILCLALEFAYRGQGALRRSLRGTGGPAAVPPANALHPYADSTWWPDFVAERAAVRGRWQPYAYSRMEASDGRFIQVDGSGLRITPLPVAEEDLPALRVFFFGGSTTFGFADRGENTRPAVVARRLHAAGFRPDVTNFGQLGYVSSQELVTLIFELRAGNVPDVVVFWDGFNDMNALRDHGVPGLTFRERQRAEGFQMRAQMEADDGSVSTPLALHSLFHRSELYGRIRQARRGEPDLTPLADPALFCRDMMDYWMGVVAVVENLAHAYGFQALMIWQPTWQSSERPRSAYEQAIEGTMILDQYRGMTQHVIRCAQMADSIVASGASSSVRNLAWIHRDDTATVFVDEDGHTTERATAIEADSVAAEILRVIAAELN